MIRVRDLGYTYAGATTPAIDGVTFDVDSGEVFGLLGPSGAGRSTTQNVLVGLLDDYDGEARVLDREARERGAALYERIGVSAERPNHHRELTARENLEPFGSLHGGPARDPVDLLDRVGLGDAVDQRVGTYSKGMQMRLNVVRALLHDPELLFLDEPTGGRSTDGASDVLALSRRRGR